MNKDKPGVNSGLSSFVLSVSRESLWVGGIAMVRKAALWESRAHFERQGSAGSCLRETLAALDALDRKVHEVLRLYEDVSSRHADGPDTFRVQMTREWLETEGKRILASLRRKIEAADSMTRKDMRAALQAAVASGDAAAQRDMSRSLHRNMLWEWADQILASVEVAFRRFPEEPRGDEPLDGFSDSTPLKEKVWKRLEADGQSPYDPVNVELPLRIKNWDVAA